MQRVIILVLLIFSAISALQGCSTDDKRFDVAEEAFKNAQEYDKDERFEEAIKRYQEVKNKFPYSKFATMAELAIGDACYKQESFPEAQISYQSFKDLHPKHPQIDYVTFRLAMSFYSQLPETVDRDLTLSSSAITFFDEVIQQYPNSEFAKESKENKAKTLKMLAGKEEYIADFYFIRKKYDSSLSRYEGLLKKFSGLGFDAKALSRAAIAAAKIGEPEKKNKYLAELKAKFPGSDELRIAEEETK
jgi:outer membrane protein assembly factor BamD